MTECSAEAITRCPGHEVRHVGIKAKNVVPTSQRQEIILGHIEVYVVIGIDASCSCAGSRKLTKEEKRSE